MVLRCRSPSNEALQRAEPACEGDLRRWVDALIAYCNYAVVQECLADLLKLFVVVPAIDVGTSYFGAEDVRQGCDLYRHVLLVR